MPVVTFVLFVLWCCALSVGDIRTRRLPNSLTGWGAAAVFGHAFAAGRFGAAAAGAVLLAVPYLLVHLARPAALGAGDVKLAVGLGAATGMAGATVWVWAALAAPLLTGFAGVGALVGRRVSERRRTGGLAVRRPNGIPPYRARLPDEHTSTVPHGPSMCAATVAALLFR
ncbi:prepilin peptidase [Nocardia paucivorans]|uniref:prepilin peptidase n=1 Tax=Nocardia paucivorans TaxID=114259 RepID=UPI0002DAE322|nr:A24 family peptidase [Nocardia paucivorans]